MNNLHTYNNFQGKIKTKFQNLLHLKNWNEWNPIIYNFLRIRDGEMLTNFMWILSNIQLNIRRREAAPLLSLSVWHKDRNLLNADFQLHCGVSHSGRSLKNKYFCSALHLCTHAYNPNITNIIIFWQIHLEMPRGHRIFINDKSHMASVWWCGAHIAGSWEETLSGSSQVQAGRSYKKRLRRGKYFIQSQTFYSLYMQSDLSFSKAQSV